MELTNCRECGHNVSQQAITCPNCGILYPAREKWDGWGYEFKSRQTLFGLPLIHISFKYRTNFAPIPAVGIIAIGQFGIGVINISQFGIGLFSLAQFTIAGYAIAQIGIAYKLIAQIGVYVHSGFGQIVWKLGELLG